MDSVKTDQMFEGVRKEEMTAHESAKYNKKEKVDKPVEKSEEDLEICGFKIGRLLGKGSYASVRAAYYNDTEVAVKIIPRNDGNQNFIQKFLPREIEAMSRLQHENIIKVYRILSYPHKVYIFMESLPEGDLLTYIRKRVRLSEGESRYFFKQAVSALQYLHKALVAHRDLKCENIMLDHNKVIKLIDFGFARRIVNSDGKRVLSETYCGSAAYAAPEVLMGNPYNPLLYDVWSVGVILFIMVAGSMPFDDTNIPKMLKLQLKRKIVFPTSVAISSNLKDLIRRVLEPDVLKRLPTERLDKHKWVTEEDVKPKTKETIPSNAAEGNGHEKKASTVH